MKTLNWTISPPCGASLDVLSPSSDSRLLLSPTSMSLTPDLPCEASTSGTERTNLDSRNDIPESNYMIVPGSSGQKLTWSSSPLSVLLMRFHIDACVLEPFTELVVWLVEVKKLTVYVEQQVLRDPILESSKEFQAVNSHIVPFVHGTNWTPKVDFIICLGENGLLSASQLFQVHVPPVMAFSLESIEFLSPYKFDKDFRNNISRVIEGSTRVLLRHRLKCVLAGKDVKLPHVQKIRKDNKHVKVHKLVLNEIVVNRGTSSFLSNIELYIEGRLVTSVQGDGLLISTPTGSSAYAVSAGSSVVHPSVPCILITPICPHSLSFRPIVVPAGLEIKVMTSPNARSTTTVSLDGRDRMEIMQEDILLITTAEYPVPSICARDEIDDWFQSLADCFNWNVRRLQKPLGRFDSYSSQDSVDSQNIMDKTHNCKVNV